MSANGISLAENELQMKRFCHNLYRPKKNESLYKSP